MNAKLQKKADDIVNNFTSLRIFSFFAKPKIINGLRQEIKHLSSKEIEIICDYLMDNLSPNDYRLFRSYLAEATGK